MNNPKRILLVEDEILVAENMKRSFIRNGYEVPSIAVTGEEAIRFAGQDKPDLVLMDIVLTGQMDGIEAADKIRELYKIPVVFLTAYSDEETLKRAKITEPFGYLTKPCEERQMFITLEMALYKDAMEKEKELLIEKLQKALEEVKTLKGFIPICAHCKKIRDDDGYWEQVEDYIRQHSEAEFSHSICPDCMKKYYPDLMEDSDDK
ncbi:response regulator [bacterium]|nr:response regulator [bacterium]